MITVFFYILLEKFCACECITKTYVCEWDYYTHGYVLRLCICCYVLDISSYQCLQVQLLLHLYERHHLMYSAWPSWWTFKSLSSFYLAKSAVKHSVICPFPKWYLVIPTPDIQHPPWSLSFLIAANPFAPGLQKYFIPTGSSALLSFQRSLPPLCLQSSSFWNVALSPTFIITWQNPFLGKPIFQGSAWSPATLDLHSATSAGPSNPAVCVYIYIYVYVYIYVGVRIRITKFWTFWVVIPNPSFFFCFCFFFGRAMRHSMRDLCSPNRDRTCVPCSGSSDS